MLVVKTPITSCGDPNLRCEITHFEMNHLTTTLLTYGGKFSTSWLYRTFPMLLPRECGKT
jgi:hypothetical protein